MFSQFPYHIRKRKKKRYYRIYMTARKFLDVPKKEKKKRVASTRLQPTSLRHQICRAAMSGEIAGRRGKHGWSEGAPGLPTAFRARSLTEADPPAVFEWRTRLIRARVACPRVRASRGRCFRGTEKRLSREWPQTEIPRFPSVV